MRFRQLEAISISKVKSGQALPDDVMVFEDGRLYGVFDGATSFNGKLINGLSPGRFAAWRCAKFAQSYVQTLIPQEFNAHHLLGRMSMQLAHDLHANACATGDAATTAALALDDGDKLQFLLVGDSGVRINGVEVIQMHKPIDRIFTAARVILMKNALQKKRDEEDWIALELQTRRSIAHGLIHVLNKTELDNLVDELTQALRGELPVDAYREIHALLAAGIGLGQPPYMNEKKHCLGFGVLNGDEVQGPDVFIFDRPRSSIHTLEFFTDGYMAPGAETKVKSWEQKWAEIEAQDPYKTGSHPHIKCSTVDEYWDDRTVLIVKN
jgi:hypothetical protein